MILYGIAASDAMPFLCSKMYPITEHFLFLHIFLCCYIRMEVVKI